MAFFHQVIGANGATPIPTGKKKKVTKKWPQGTDKEICLEPKACSKKKKKSVAKQTCMYWALPYFHTFEGASFCRGHKFWAVFRLPPGLVPGMVLWPEEHPPLGSVNRHVKRTNRWVNITQSHMVFLPFHYTNSKLTGGGCSSRWDHVMSFTTFLLCGQPRYFVENKGSPTALDESLTASCYKGGFLIYMHAYTCMSSRLPSFTLSSQTMIYTKYEKQSSLHLAKTL